MSTHAGAMRPVLIVGGGIGGLASSLALADRGYPSIVFESRRTSAHVDRGDVLHPAVLPLLARWGAESDLARHEPVRFHYFRVADHTGRILLEADTLDLFGLDRYFTAIRHPNLINVLRAAAMRSGLVDLRDGELCTSLAHDGRRVCGVNTTVGRHNGVLTVIATGARSNLPAAFFGPASVYRYRSAFVNACVRAIDGYADCGYYVLGAAGAMVLVPLPGGQQRVGVQVAGSDLDRVADPDFMARTAAARYVPLAGARLEIVERPRVYRLRRAVRSSWWVPGAVLVGDVAHQVHPVGGQGMNLAMCDADALAGSLGAVGFGVSDIDWAARRYAQLRHRYVHRALKRTHALGLMADRPFTAGQLALVRLINRVAPVKRALLGSMLHVR